MRGFLLATCVLLGACGGGGSQATDDGGSNVDPTDAAGSNDATDAPAAAGRSAGCGMATTNPPATFVARTIMTDRTLFVRVPTGYDPSRAYPIVYELHGCSGSATREDNNVPVEKQPGADAIFVRGRAAATCWDTSPGGADAPYFDAMLADVEGAFCVDTNHRFVTGYSSGSFMAHAMACSRGDQLRGVATIAGGQQGNQCTGAPAALLIHDADDTTVNISASIGARDMYLTRNACAMPPTSTATDHPPCVAYAGCAPGQGVTWCQTSGKQHDRQDALAGPIFWSFIAANL